LNGPSRKERKKEFLPNFASLLKKEKIKAASKFDKKGKIDILRNFQMSKEKSSNYSNLVAENNQLNNEIEQLRRENDELVQKMGEMISELRSAKEFEESYSSLVHYLYSKNIVTDTGDLLM